MTKSSCTILVIGIWSSSRPALQDTHLDDRLWILLFIVFQVWYTKSQMTLSVMLKNTSKGQSSTSVSLLSCVCYANGTQEWISHWSFKANKVQEKIPQSSQSRFKVFFCCNLWQYLTYTFQASRLRGCQERPKGWDSRADGALAHCLEHLRHEQDITKTKGNRDWMGVFAAKLQFMLSVTSNSQHILCAFCQVKYPHSQCCRKSFQVHLRRYPTSTQTRMNLLRLRKFEKESVGRVNLALTNSLTNTEIQPHSNALSYFMNECQCEPDHIE